MGLTLVFTESATLTASTPASATVTVSPPPASATVDVTYSQPATVNLSTGLPGPKGDTGTAATVDVGSTTTLAPGASATVVNVGTTSAAVFNFGVPQGPQGQQGIQGIQGPVGPVGPTGVIAATAPLSYNSGTRTVSIDLSAYLTTSAATATFYPLSSNPAGYLTSASLGGYATQAWTNANFYPLSSNPAGYVTPSALSGYATQAWVTSQGYLTSSSLVGYATQTWVSAQGYITASALSPYLTSATAATLYAPLARGIPSGGTTGQVLSKVNGTDYNVAWTTPASAAAWGSITGTLSSQTDLQSALNAKADLSSPTFTGDPKAPTPATGDNDTSIATTAFVKAQGYLTSAPVTSVAGRTGAITLAVADVSGAAPLASPTFTGTPLSTTPTTSDNSTKIATTAFVKAQGYTTVSGDRYSTTSTTSNSISNGTKTFTVASGLSYTPTQDVTVAYTVDALNHHMHAQVVSYSGTTLVVDVAQHTGSGTYSSWTVNVGGISSIAVWGTITGTLSSQTDLQSALDAKLAVTTAASTYQPIGSYIGDAPSDGNYYMRRNGAWEVVNIY